MRRYSLLLVFSSVIFVTPAYAGFEWLPPSQMPAMVEAYNVPATVPSNVVGGGAPRMPVISEPLGRNVPTSILPQRQSIKNLSRTGLFIDPYPLRAQGINQSIELSASSVEQAMIEQAHILNPLPLGVGLKTGAQPTPAIMPSARAGRRTGHTPRAPSGGLTPMTGGEPLSLPGTVGMSQSSFKQQGPHSATPIVRYAEAVGFGRDLPLALALSQVIPMDFSHSYIDGVDAGINVSWEGGVPWNQVLENMLNPKGLTASIQRNKVIIKPLTRL